MAQLTCSIILILILILLRLSLNTAFPWLSPYRDINLRDSISGSTSASLGVSTSATTPASASTPIAPPLYTWSPSLLVDVTQAHAYQDPLPGQARGPCPAQNALANHGYYNRDGSTTFLRCVQMNGLVYSMSPDFAGILCLLGQVMGGDEFGLSPFSIGNSSSFDNTVKQDCPLSFIAGLLCKLTNILDKALGTAGFGMAQTHNSFEADSSFLRYDWGMYGVDASTVDPSMANLLWANYRDNSGNFDNFTKIIDWASYRKNYCIATNPCYFRVPQATLFASQAAYVLVPKIFSNNTPTGPTLTSDTAASFFGLVVDKSGQVSSKGFGKEQIPANWYKSPNLYTVPQFTLDYSQFFERDRSLADLGGNTNGVNTFTGLDLGNFTGGVINGENLLDGDNFVCLWYRVFQIYFGDKLSSPVEGDLLSLGATLGAVIDKVFGAAMKSSAGVSTCRTDYSWTDPHAFSGYCAVQRQPGGMY